MTPLLMTVVTNLRLLWLDAKDDALQAGGGPVPVRGRLRGTIG